MKSIIAMNSVVGGRELEAVDVSSINIEETHYWHVERRAKRGKRWIFVRDLIGTKKEAAELWNKFFRGKGFRLRHMMKYQRYPKSSEGGKVFVWGGEVYEYAPVRPPSGDMEDMPF